jgi:putative ABC transport system permease protein
MSSLLSIHHRLRRRLRALLMPRTVERELDEELGFHLAMEIEHNVRQGLSPAEARATALREFGGIDHVKQQAMRSHGIGPLESVAGDVRFALRSLRRSPVFSAVAVLTLALGIGVTTAVYSVVDGVLLRPLPYPEPDRLVRLHERSPSYDRAAFSGATFADVRTESRTLSAVAAYAFAPATVLGADEPVRAGVSWISRDFFRVLGVRPARGRAPAPEEGATATGPQVALVSHEFWRTALGGDPAFAERSLHVSGVAYPLVGVMPPGFRYPARGDVWLTAVDDNPSRTAHNYAVIGRLASGATLAEARAELGALMRRLAAAHGERMSSDGVTLNPLHDELARSARTSVLVLAAAVGLVLLIACVNLASANLARGEGRQRELAVRTALGAARGRLVRQILTENLVLAALGGALGVALAWGLTRLLVLFGPAALPGFVEVRVDLRVLVVAAVVSILTGLLIGLAPAAQVTRDLRGAIAQGGTAGGTAGGSRGRLRARGLLVSAEVALALVLLAGAGLLVKSLRTLLGEDPGFRPERVLTADVGLPSSIYSDTTRIAGFFDQLLPTLRAIPGVESAGMIDQVPLGSGGSSSGFMVDGGEDVVGNTDYRLVDSTYFRTLGIPLVRGRGFTPADRAGAPHAVVVNQAMAAQFWPDGSAIGRRIRFPGMDDHASEWLTVVGIVGDVRDEGLEAPATPAAFIHYPQRPERLTRGATLVVRATTPPAPLAAAVRARVRATDGNVPVSVSSLEAVVKSSVASRRFSTAVLATFAALALLLAALGIYGVLAYSVAQRQREIGVRLALGARQRTVRAMVLRDAMRAVLPGVVLGLVGAVALTRLLRGLLYGVSAADPVVFVGVSVLLTAVAVAASWVPARRAARVDPMVAIRVD